jgi:hypothetical protein
VAARALLLVLSAWLAFVFAGPALAADETEDGSDSQHDTPAADYSTLNSVAKSFGITDEDIKSGSTDLFECLRAVASNGGKHISRLSAPLDPDKLKEEVLGKLALDRSVYAAQSLLKANSRRVMIRGPNGMYESFRQVNDTCVTTLVRGGDPSQRLTQMVRDVEASNVPGEYSRCFFGTNADGDVFLCEELCAFDDNAQPLVFSETYAVRFLEGTWRDYLARQFIVVTLDEASSKKRTAACKAQATKTLFGFRKKWLAQEAGLADNADSDFAVDEQSASGPAVVCVFGDCLLWVEGEPFKSLSTITKPVN